MTYTLDHIAVVCADLDVGSGWLEAQLGVPLLDGGTHARFGTHNRLLGVADGLYLEVIAPDPKASIAGPRWFDLDNAPAMPRWGNWICRADDLAEQADLTGSAIAMTRGDLNWQITVPADGGLPMQGGFPTLIKWENAAAHPAQRLPDSGCRLTKWEVKHPQAVALQKLCPMSGEIVTFRVSDVVGFTATFQTPTGTKVIS